MAYEWRANPACVATYKILEGDKFLDQFEDTQIPFDDAGPIQMGKLRYFPKTTSNAAMIGLIAEQMALRFITYIDKTFTVEKEDSTEKTAQIVRAVAKVFANRDATICDLAEVTDAHVRFPNEA